MVATSSDADELARLRSDLQLKEADLQAANTAAANLQVALDGIQAAQAQVRDMQRLALVCANVIAGVDYRCSLSASCLQLV